MAQTQKMFFIPFQKDSIQSRLVDEERQPTDFEIASNSTPSCELVNFLDDTCSVSLVMLTIDE